jgi:hypothetical protein
MLAYSEVMAIAALMVVPPLLGLLLDLQLKISPWGVLLGAGLGVGSGIARLVRWSESISRRVPHGPVSKSLPRENVLPEDSQQHGGKSFSVDKTASGSGSSSITSHPTVDRAAGQLGQSNLTDC